MGTSSSDPVWYACYGSNCSWARFATYLTGGVPAGASMAHPGARDPSLPREKQPTVFGSQICFTGYAVTWDGAPAFLEHQASPEGAWGRRYLISASQFADVFDQENRRLPATTTLPELADLEPETLVVMGNGKYDALVILEPVAGVPCLSFTSPDPPERRPAAAPSAAYLSTIVRGLLAGGTTSPSDLADHLLRASGVALAWDRDSLRSLIAAEAAS